MRINKYISTSGYCSRRQADKIVEEGRVFIDDKKACLGDTVDDENIENIKVTVDGKQIFLVEEKIYIAFNKPVGVECTASKKVKENIIDYINYPKRIFPVGRLDKGSQGLILLSNDGEVSNRLMMARYEHEKEYIVVVDKLITKEFIVKMGAGVDILDVTTRECKVDKISDYKFRITLTQGLNRQIRRMTEALGYNVTSLTRIRIEHILLGELEKGNWRDLTQKEIDELKVRVNKEV